MLWPNVSDVFTHFFGLVHHNRAMQAHLFLLTLYIIMFFCDKQYKIVINSSHHKWLPNFIVYYIYEIKWFISVRIR